MLINDNHISVSADRIRLNVFPRNKKKKNPRKKLSSSSVKELRKRILRKYTDASRRCIIQTIRRFVNDDGDIARKY